MASLLELSHELLHCILTEINGSDLAALSQTCRVLHRYISGNRVLHRDLYLRQYDSAPPDTNWEKDLHSAVRLHKILESGNVSSKKAEHLPFVASQIDLLLQRLPPGTGPSANLKQLLKWFCDDLNIDAFLCGSSLYARVGNRTHVQLSTLAHRQASAKLHCLFGVPVEYVSSSINSTHETPSPHSSPSIHTRSKTRWPKAHMCARSKVYDLREYTDQTLWGPFLPDGSQNVDWEKVEAIMIVLGYNLTKFTERSMSRFSQIWTVPWVGASPNSFQNLISPPPTIEDQSGDPDSEKRRELTAALDAQDPYGISGTWLRVVCFLDYNDLYAFNFAGQVPDDQPREPIDTEEAIRLIRIKLQVERISPPGSGDSDEEEDGMDWSRFKGERLPVVHFRGSSRSMHASWDPNANSRIRGTVRQTPEGEIRWTTFSIFHGEERWRSEGVQVGGIRSARGVLGNWFDKDFNEHGPAGPTAFWKISDHFEEDKTTTTFHLPLF